METYAIVHKYLLELEKQYFPKAKTLYATPGDCATGGIQFGVVDNYQNRSAEPMPVVCAFGINYTREKSVAPAFFPYIGRDLGPKVEQGTNSRDEVAFVIAAYNRNTDEWTANSELSVYYENQSGPLGSRAATAKSKLVGIHFADLRNKFILVMTNRCPFITSLDWQDQVNTNWVKCDALLKEWPNNDYLDDLYSRLGKSVDLWIGHSSIYGTEFVWPYFKTFIQRHAIQEWLLAPNINPRANLQFDGQFCVPEHKLFPLFRKS